MVRPKTPKKSAPQSTVAENPLLESFGINHDLKCAFGVIDRFTTPNDIDPTPSLGTAFVRRNDVKVVIGKPRTVAGRRDNS
jgi:hypothetical protein